jgi:DNA-binding NarL/FixJ family response regulator
VALDLSFVGRGPEVSLLTATVADVLAGQSRVIVIEGDPGVGKTRLLSWLVDLARRRGLAVLRGEATEFEHLLPFAAYADALGPLADTTGAADRLGEFERAALETLISTVSGRGKGGTGFDRFHILRGVRQLLVELCTDRGVLLALDDLHWADEPSMELTAFLLRRSLPAPLLVTLVCRAGQLPAMVGDALARMEPAPTRIDLAPLDDASVASLLRHLGSRRRHLLSRASGGNPLYLRMLADASEQTLGGLADGDPEPGSAAELPLLAVLRHELDALPEPTQRVARAAAVAGDHASLQLVAHIAGMSPSDTASAVDDLCHRGVGTALGTRFAFRHPLLRGAAYGTAGPGWRVQAHARAADFLRGRDGSLAVRAHHTERCAQPGDEDAARTLGDAGSACLDSAPTTAVRLLREALRVLPHRDDLIAYRADLLTSVARGLGVTGHLAESRVMLQEIMRLPREVRVPAVAFSSVVSRLLGRLDEAAALLATEAARCGPSRIKAQLLAELAAVSVLQAGPRAARRYAQAALALLDEGADAALAAAAQALQALAYLQEGDLTASRKHTGKARSLLDAVPDVDLLPHVEMIAPLAWVETTLEDFDDAHRHLIRGIDIATRAGRSHALPYLLISQTMLLTSQGRLADAIGAGQHAADLSRHIQSEETLAMAQAVLLPPTLWREGPGVVAPLADAVRAAPPRSRWWAGLADLLLAQVDLAGGRSAVSSPESPTEETQVFRLAVQATAAGVRGDDRDALARATEAVSRAEQTGVARQLATAYAAQAGILLRTGNLADAAARARAAVAQFSAAGAVVDRGRSHELLAEVRARQGDIRAARVELGEAKSAYGLAGADWLARRLARAEVRLGAQVPRSGRLTSREREVVDLIGTGLTNREIASCLHLSPKTIETHVARLFSKFDVRSRAALVSRLAGSDGDHGGPPAGG